MILNIFITERCQATCPVSPLKTLFRFETAERQSDWGSNKLWSAQELRAHLLVPRLGYSRRLFARPYRVSNWPR